MPKRDTDNIAHRAWNLLRLALLWGRKGGVFKRRLVMELRLVPKYIKSLRHTTPPPDQIRYGERELSFDKTPLFNVKMHGCRLASMRFHLPHIPCINQQADFDCDFDGEEDDYEYDGRRKGFLIKSGYDEEKCGHESSVDDHHQMISCEEQGIDARAEEFINNFYQQMKQQRQISYLKYNEMLNRGTS
ncbi:Long cell-linked locus protein, putative, expressed [Quillaja saponaria]|uniref:Long cell-linked locus protein, putative, expressed n=1 Tax=Quillaja saponaria TaxID=32244 RepID=A0AAD7Q1D2_QUISA|nr:Long cell-linked locus protein, putative, expressed [Quillaja saponaria]